MSILSKSLRRLSLLHSLGYSSPIFNEQVRSTRTDRGFGTSNLRIMLLMSRSSILCASIISASLWTAIQGRARWLSSGRTRTKSVSWTRSLTAPGQGAFDTSIVAMHQSSHNTGSNDQDAGLRGRDYLVVLTRMRHENLTWIQEHLPGYHFLQYVADGMMHEQHPPKNKGHEVMNYLSFIIERYEQLPDVVIFMHAHRFAHHNSDLLEFDAVQMLERLRVDYIVRQGYVNMRCGWSPGCPDGLQAYDSTGNIQKQEAPYLLRTWHEMFPGIRPPSALSQTCCAQFAVSKKAIHAIPLSRYIFFRDWLLKTPLSDYTSGRMWEYMWHYIFTEQSTFCPLEHECYCQAYGICFNGPDRYADFERLRSLKRDLQDELHEMKPSRSSAALRLMEKIQAIEKELKAETQTASEMEQVRGLARRRRAYDLVN